MFTTASTHTYARACANIHTHYTQAEDDDPNALKREEVSTIRPDHYDQPAPKRIRVDGSAVEDGDSGVNSFEQI